MVCCTSCGEQVTNDGKFCPKCGAPVQQTEVSNEQKMDASTSKIEGEKGKKSFFKSPLFFGLIAVFIVVASVGAAMLMKKTPRELYLYAEYKTFEKAKEDFDEKYGEMIAFQMETLQNASTSEMTISGDFENKALQGDESYEMIKEILSQTTLSVKAEQDPNTMVGKSTIGFNVEGETAFDIQMLQSENQAGIKVPVLYDKFFYLKYDEYGQLMRTFDPSYVGPETLNMKPLDWEKIILSDSEKEYLIQEYSTFLINNLPEEYFSLKEDVEYTYKGEEMKLREVTLSLSAEETAEFMNEFLDLLIKDDELHEIIINRVLALEETVAIAEEMNIDKEDMKKELKSTFKEMKTSLADMSFGEGFESTILINNKEQIIDRQMEITLEDQYEAVEFKMSSKNLSKDDQQSQEVVFEISDPKFNRYQYDFSISNDSKSEKDNRTENAVLNYKQHSFGNLQQDIQLQLDSDIKGNDGLKQDITTDYKLIVDEIYDETEINGVIKQENDTNVNDKKSTSKVEVTVDLEEAGLLTLFMDSKVQLRDGIDGAKIDEELATGLNVATLTPEEMNTIMQEEVIANMGEIFAAYGIALEDFLYDDAYYDDPAYYEDAFYYEEAVEQPIPSL